MQEMSVENWLEPDPRSRLWVGLDDEGEASSLEGDDWFKMIHEPELRTTVPDEVAQLLAVARAAMTYGYFYYPLYALGSGQLGRVGEAAVRHRCRLEGLDEPDTFGQALHELREVGQLTDEGYERWDALRDIRNQDSHAMNQKIIAPGMAVGVLTTLIDQINDLYQDAESGV